MPPVVQHPPWGDGSLCLLYVTHLLQFLWETAPNTATHTPPFTTHQRTSSSFTSEWSKLMVQVHGRFMSKAGELLLHRRLSPLPVSWATQTQRAVSSIMLFRLQNWSLSLMLWRQSYFLPFTIVSCYSYSMCIIQMHIIHTVFASVCHCDSEQRPEHPPLKNSGKMSCCLKSLCTC